MTCAETMDTTSKTPNAKPGLKSIATSKMGRRRAWVLIGVHVVAAVHIWHWRATGSSLTPVEPSEAMQTLELGYVNAGFLFFAFAILSTLVFGRWFCGWGCHVVALQDLSAWVLKKIGIRPKPIRSRLLVWVPVFAALYMFVYPQIVRLWDRRDAPAWTWHLTTEDFWSTFPNAQIALLTFAVCGFLIVYLLGSKGFCTYGCPYGGIFYHVDRLAKGRIRVTEDCNACGHCTAVCTSNVRVAEEVSLHRMVVDPGCMKCMDCVSVCPSGALYFGFGTKPGKSRIALPMVHSEPPAPKPREWDFSWKEEAFLALAFAIGFYAFRGLYDAIPFLLALGLASITSVLLLFAVRLAYRPHVRFQRSQLKSKGRLTNSGVGYIVFALLICAVLAHSVVLQFWTHEGARQLQLATSSKGLQAARSGREAYAKAISLSVFPIAEWHYRLGSLEQNLGEIESATKNFERALELQPDRPNTRLQAANLYVIRGNWEAACRHFEFLVADGVDLRAAWADYALGLIRLGKTDAAIGPLKRVVEKKDADPKLRLMLGMALAEEAKLAESEDVLQKFVNEFPSDPNGRLNLGLVLALNSNWPGAERELMQAVVLDSKNAPAWSALGRVRSELQNPAGSYSALRRALEIQPLSPTIVQDFADAAGSLGKTEPWLADIRSAAKAKPQLYYAASALLRRQGKVAEADDALGRARVLEPNLPSL